MLKASFKAQKPGDMPFTMTLTMTLDEWRELSDAIKGQYPGWVLKGEITRLVFAATKHFDDPIEGD